MLMGAEELRALDAEVHQKVMGLHAEFGRHSEYESSHALHKGLWEREDWWAVTAEPTPPGHNRRCFPVPHYSTDIAAAWLVVERLQKLLPHCYVEVLVMTSKRGGFLSRCRVANMDDEFTFNGADSYDASVPLAICRAALKAVEAL
jgi:hypothetical protein